MAINLDNISAAFGKVKAVANNISIISHSENVALENIVPSDYNPYNEYDTQNDNQAVRQLADSIAVQGLIEPIVLNKVKDKYIILSGERRYKAIKLLNWKSVPAQVYDNLDTTTANLILHTSNLEVRDYTSGQKLIFYKDVRKLLEDMKSKGQLTGGMQKALANMLHINERQVRKYERICNELSEDEQEQIINNEVSINDGYKVAQERKNERVTNNKSELDTDSIEDVPAENKKDTLAYEPTPQALKNENSEQYTKKTQDTSNEKSFENIQDDFQESVLDYVFKLYGKDKLIRFYKSFIPTQNEAIDYFVSYFSSELKSVVKMNKTNKNISINNDTYEISYIDVLIRRYIREEQ
ncbi:MAG: ParB/RepB/Spo0J family partition protein [Acutalibacteraceae bacterium]|nr:ParB/RepB/Spo0J family partition protein [Acutalibacteraceae bacterium]